MGVALILVLLVVGLVLAALILWLLLKGSLSTAKLAGQTVSNLVHNEHEPRQHTEPTWGHSAMGGPPVTELVAEPAGALSPFGQDHQQFPLPVDRIRYAHPTDRPNRAGLMASSRR